MKGYLGINIIFVGWIGQDYGIDKYAYSRIGLAGAAMLKIWDSVYILFLIISITK